jgi:hypothetical protein
MTYESNRLYATKAEHRSAIVKKGSYFCEGKYVVDFYYDNASDFEWKRGAHGMSCDICDTFEQAKRKANNYVKKDNQ